MKSRSKSTEKQKIKEKKDKVENINFSPKKKLNEANITNSINSKKYLKSPITLKKQKLTNDKFKNMDFKEQYSLYMKELQNLRNKEEEIKELKDKLKLQTDAYNNNFSKNKKDTMSYTSAKIKKKVNEDNFPETPMIFKKNLVNFIEKGNKNTDGNRHITSHSYKNVRKNHPIAKQIETRKKININLFSPKINKNDFQKRLQDLKNKFNSPCKTIFTARNRNLKNKYDLDNQQDLKKNKKTQSDSRIGIISKPGTDNNDKLKKNQDNYFNYNLKNGYKLVGVCDGHGENGRQVSEFIKNNLPKELENEFNILITNERKRLSILKGMLKRNDENNSEKTENSNIENNIDFEKMNELLKKVYISTNLKLLAENMKLNLKTSGSTCISVLFKKSIKKAYISNVGDSRAIIIKEHENSETKENIWSYEQLSRDHKPSEKDEEERIIKYGGEIQKIKKEDGTYEGPLRIFKKNEEGPGLAMSRSFGDIDGESIGIIAEPEVKEYQLTKDDKAIIIATDGLWEYTTNEEVVNVVKNLWNKKDANIIINELYKLSTEKWNKENCNRYDTTSICVLLN